MSIQVTYEDSDVSTALKRIIKDPNAEEFVKLLTPMLCQSSYATAYFFKLMIGGSLPDVIADHTICKTRVENLGYSSNKDLIRSRFADSEDKVAVIIKAFRGYHEYSQYAIEYTNVLPSGETKVETTYVSAKELEPLDDF